MNGFDFSRLTDMLLQLIIAVFPSLLCITLHEISHGYVAYLLGDNTAKNMGRLSLNPVKHIDPVGLIMMIVFRFGWAKPVPINMRNFKNPKGGMALSALAGPAANIIIAAVFMLLYGLLFTPLYSSSAGRFFLQIINNTMFLSIGLAVFNLLPFPPLDGSKILFSLLSDRAYMKLMRYERYGGIALLLLSWFGLLSGPLSAAIDWVAQRMYPLVYWGYDLFNLFFS